MADYYYKTNIIYVPDNYKDSLDKVKELCQKLTGTKYKINEERVGLKHLTYPLRISKTGDDFYKQGYCVTYTWHGKLSNVQELEKYLYNDDNVLKFTTLLTTKEEAHLEPYKCEQKKPIDILDIIYGLNNKNNKNSKS